LLGGFLFGLLGLSASGIIGNLICAFVGAIVLLVLIGFVKRKGPEHYAKSVRPHLPGRGGLLIYWGYNMSQAVGAKSTILSAARRRQTDVLCIGGAIL
jgi:hypothetical protein